MLAELRREMRHLANPETAEALQWFFKTGPGEYGEGDRFLGIRVPQQRRVATKYATMSLPQVLQLLHSKFHEHRLTALLILVAQFQRAQAPQQKRIFDAYLKNTQFINNWDLVDSSASQIVGAYLLGRSHRLLDRLARSKSLWERRIAVISTLAFIKEREYETTLRIAERLLGDEHDLIHKAVGWMLREVGNRDRKVEERFLDQHSRQMPRTMLRYAVERLPKIHRQHYMRR